MENKKIGNGPSFEEIAVIEKATGGKIGTHEWWVVKGVNENFTTKTKPSHEEDIIYHGVLENSFMSQGGEYIGNFDKAKWYCENRLKVYEPYPMGVAIVLDENGNIEGYVGYTHRGASIFKLGERLFNASYEPGEEDYIPEEWQSYLDRYNKSLADAEAEGDEWWINDIRKDGIRRVVPFKMRGSRIIENWDDAIQAAINMSKYLS